MGGNSCTDGCGFESQHHILDGHFSHVFGVKIVMFVWKDEISGKEVGDSPFRKPIGDVWVRLWHQLLDSNWSLSGVRSDRSSNWTTPSVQSTVPNCFAIVQDASNDSKVFILIRVDLKEGETDSQNAMRVGNIFCALHKSVYCLFLYTRMTGNFAQISSRYCCLDNATLFEIFAILSNEAQRIWLPHLTPNICHWVVKGLKLTKRGLYLKTEWPLTRVRYEKKK